MARLAVAGSPILLLLALATASAGQSVPRGHPDLYAIDLVPTPDLRQVEATVRLGRVPSPFGVSVSASGHQRYRLSIEATNLPGPASLGEYSTYVAWVTTPVMHPVVKLGEIGNGSYEDLGDVEWNRFVVLVSAEASPDVETRTGRLVLRGTSPSSRIQPDNHLMLPPTSAGGGRRGHGAHLASPWPHPPMHPLVPMIPGLEDLRPELTPFLPSADEGENVPDARPREIVKLRDGQTLDLEARKVRRAIHGRSYVMYGFNGQYPGPLIDVEQASTVTVNVTNGTEWPTAIHWHGVRLENRYDGVPGVTQEPILPGESFQYRVFFKDAGIYWYHPHHREDVQQDLGLYGNMLVRAPSETFFNEVHREEVLMLDDLLVTERGLYPYGKERATHALMGRFGNVLLVNGEPTYSLAVERGEVVRFFLTNASNTRTFNLDFGGAPIKVVGSDLGKLEREVRAESVVIAPAERYIIEVRFDEPGETALTNRVQVLDHTFGNFFSEDTKLGAVKVAEKPVDKDLSGVFDSLRRHEDVVRDIDPYRSSFERPLDFELVFTLEVDGLDSRIMQRMRADRIYFPPVEWSGTMPMMNLPSTSREARWILRDGDGRENLDIDWRFRVGDVAKIRLTNDRDAIHAMQHPFHVHGQRFLVLSRNGEPNENLVWKDTMLLAVGETADILLELSNPGRWMAHCHIAEHLETGMKFVFTVEP